VIIFIWNATHGGKGRKKDEFRIQITGVSDFQKTTGYKTLILGWYDEAKVFAGWDIRQHLGPVSSSPSMQISISALEQAEKTGFAFYVNQKGETAISVRPDFLGTYISFWKELHDSGRQPAEASILEKLSESAGSVSEAEIDADVKKKRRFAVSAVRRALRAADFSKRVLDAYGHKCAMCGVQLELLDAAHVLPASDLDSTDETSNGVALCLLHHRAYDNALVFFDKSFKVLINGPAIARLKRNKRDSGVVEFQKSLLPTLSVPTSKAMQPAANFICKANALRRVK
jgi:putative restriction endonuclease